METLLVAADIAKLTFPAAVWDGDRLRDLGTFPNTPPGFAALARALAPLQQQTHATAIHLTLEPTGGYELALARFALEQGWQVSLPNPALVRKWAQGTGRRAKTDRLDARVLVAYSRAVPLPAWQPLPADVSELDSLLRRKDDLAAMLRQERNRRAAIAPRPGVAKAVPGSLDRVIGDLEAALREIEQAIKDHLAQHCALQARVRDLLTVPGIGRQNVLYILVVVARWGVLTEGHGSAKGLVAYVGLDPQTRESGTSVRGARTISRQGNRGMRQRLFMSALGGMHGQNVLRTYYRQLVSRGKAKMVALVAAARKILTWAWAVYRDHTVFTPERAKSRTAATA